MTLRYLLLFSVAVLSLLRPSHVKQVNAASVSTKMKVKTAVVLAGLTALQQVNAGYDCKGANTGDPAVQCGKNQCCSLSEACEGVDNTACPPHDGDITVSCKACCGKSACDAAIGATVGIASCNGDASCFHAKASNIGNHSCRKYKSCYYTASSKIGNDSCQGEQTCQEANYATIGDNSCNNDFACYFCSSQDKRVTVPSNSCNVAGWEGNYFYNQCPYCKQYCKIQATGQDCNASTLQANAAFENSSSKCSEVKTAVVNFIKSHDDFKNPLLNKLIHAQTTAELRQNEKGIGVKNRSKCVVDFELNYFHLGTKQEIDSACKEFESLFSNSKSALLKQLKKELKNVPSFTVTCVRKDWNAVS